MYSSAPMRHQHAGSFRIMCEISDSPAVAGSRRPTQFGCETIYRAIGCDLRNGAGRVKERPSRP
jgi:hypothetical protein